jgi:hypothetical protein
VSETDSTTDAIVLNIPANSGVRSGIYMTRLIWTLSVTA